MMHERSHEAGALTSRPNWACAESLGDCFGDGDEADVRTWHVC